MTKYTTTFTDIYPCTEENHIYFQMAMKVLVDTQVSSLATTLKRVEPLKEYAKQRYAFAYEASDCKVLAKISPDSQKYYEALTGVLDWQNASHIEDYWHWRKMRISLSDLLLRPFNPVLSAMLNYVFGMNCTTDDWNEAVKIISAIDPLRLAGNNVIVDFPNRSYKLDRFYGH